MIHLFLDLCLIQPIDDGVVARCDVNYEPGQFSGRECEDFHTRRHLPRLTFLSEWKETCPTAILPVF